MSVLPTDPDQQPPASARPLLSLRALVLLVVSATAGLLLYATALDAVGATAVAVAVLVALTALVE